MIRKVPIFIISTLILSCTSTTSTTSLSNNADLKELPAREYSVQSVLWQQQSAEYKALCHQAFNLAKARIDQALAAQETNPKPLAIITDVDETVIDNSPYNAKMIETDQGYTKESWVAWGALQQATPIPGAIDFFNYAANAGIAIFYISNRYDVQFDDTKSNLSKIGFPITDDAHILLRTTTSGKQARRQQVLSDHDVILYLGDNLSDFAADFEKKSTQERNANVEKLKTNFGKEYIVLPNPMYGDWETKGIYQGNYSWTQAQKDSIRKKKLRSY